MSISVDESGKSWSTFFDRERAKYPHFMKEWFDTDGLITGNRNRKVWNWEVRKYLDDRREFLSTISQIEKPPTASSFKKEKTSTHKQGHRPAQASDQLAKKTKAIPTGSLGKSHPPRSSKQAVSTMPRPTKRSQAWKRSTKKRRGGNKALRSVKIPFKMVIEVNSAKSSAETGHWHNHLTIAELAGPALKVHEEFKCCSMKVRFIPEDITTGSGLYAACLLDQNGFGDPAQATTVWFPRVADLPGARLCHVTRGCVFTWHPTEPDSRNFKKSATESDTVVASFYIFGNSSSLSIKGQLLITGLLRARGEYYSANIASRIRELSLLDASGDTPDDIVSLDD